ncbi:hypothetical protein FEM48_Zijuj04G0120800 [Ziziphus jujuba var. spinosa]|uniref:Uncharacterized protein n=1 Tax=Ziziphus jujuba var. spinosa TaxID=714518 RepID=A0A978VJS4_ZIZJJ|nr:hypothetical protein FEM48_Zijuj04G0120800 [Ziziphus jujuba var. spinosa]
MVVPLGPGKFYGTSLPRPRIYTDVKLNDERVDPPVPVLDPFLSWASEAHWSMGGLSFKRLRLQGRIEGSVKKLQAEREKFAKRSKIVAGSSIGSGSSMSDSKRAVSISPPAAPMATKRRRLMALIDEDDDDSSADEEEEEEEVGVVAPSRGVKRRLVKRLWDDFDRVASEAERGKGSPLKGLSGGSEGMASRTRSRKTEEDDEVTETVMKVVEEVKMSTHKGKRVKGGGSKGQGNGGNASPAVSRVRTSPRLAKRG